jgi:hypothetical protein
LADFSAAERVTGAKNKMANQADNSSSALVIRFMLGTSLIGVG